MADSRNVIHKSEDIADFLAAADELISCKFILCERRISELLKTIARNKELMALFAEALSGYNYSIEFNRSRTAVKGKPKLVLPKNQARKIAYVFCLLMEFDSGKRNVKDFLDEYYYMPQPNDSLALFCRDMIEVFKDVTEYLYVNGIETLLENEEIDYSLRKQVGGVIDKLNSLVMQTTVVGTDTKRDLHVVLSAIENALTPNKADCLRALIVGLEHIARESELYRLMSANIIELKGMLITADLI